MSFPWDHHFKMFKKRKKKKKRERKKKEGGKKKKKKVHLDNSAGSHPTREKRGKRGEKEE